MKSLRRYLPLLALLLMVATGATSCRDASHRREIRDALQRAETLMETDPHAARAALDSLNPNSSSPIPNSSFLIPNFPRKGDKALYALLRTQADYKNHTRLTTDTLIRIATDYYGTKRKSQRAALAQYYLGCTNSNMGRDMDAIDALLLATTLFPDTTDRYYANSLFKMGKLYLQHHMDDKAYSMFNRYRATDVCNSDSVNIGFADYYMGKTSSYMGDALLADSLFQCVIKNESFPKSFRDYTFFELAKLNYYHRHDAETALNALNKYFHSFKDEEDNGAAFLLLADIQSSQNDSKNAYENYCKALENSIDIYTRCGAYKGLANLSSSDALIADSTRFYIDRYSILLDSIYAFSKRQEIVHIENNHFLEQKESEQRRKLSRYYWTASIILVISIFFSVVMLLLNDRRHKVKELKYEQQLKAIEKQYIQDNLKEEPEERRDPMDKPNIPPVTSDSQPDIPFFTFQQNRLALYRAQYETGKWNHYFILHGDDIHDEQFMPIGEAEAFLQYTSELFVNLTASLLRENPHINKDDVNFCCLTMLGFTTKQIAYCCRKPVKYCYNRRTRLSERLTPEWYQFIFGKQPKQA